MSANPERASEDVLTVEDLREIWSTLSPTERVEAFLLAPRPIAEDFYLGLAAREACDLLLQLPSQQQRSWIRLLPPDDAADLIQCAREPERARFLDLLDDPTRKEVSGLLAYREDEAGGLMSPRYVRLRPEMSVDEAISYVRRAARDRLEAIHYIYVVDSMQHLVGVISFRELFATPPAKTVGDVMHREFVSVRDDADQEEVARTIRRERLMAVPVLDDEGRIHGIVTVDDAIDVIIEEQTEDMYRMAGIGVQERATSPMLE